MAGWLGADAGAVARNYPCFLDSVPSNSIVHLSNQSLALVFLVHRLPKTVITVHDILPYAGLSRWSGLRPPGTLLDHLLIRLNARCISRAARILADSHQTRKDLVGLLHIHPAKIDVVPLGVDHDVFRPSVVHAAFCERYSLQQDKRYILYAGSKEPRKNLRTLCAAVGRVVKQVPNATLLIAGRPGTPQQEANLRESLQEVGMANRARCLPLLPWADLPLMYNLATVFAFPSLQEGFGLPPLEAMACGCPVVASNASSIPEVVGDAALLVDARDAEALAAALIRVLTDEEYRHELSCRGIERARAFTWDRTADLTVRTYERTLSEA